MEILYEDRDIIVIDKSAGLLTVSRVSVSRATVSRSSGKDRSGVGNDDTTAYSLLTQYVRKGNSKSRNRVFIVHRLDRDTSGVLVFAKSEPAKRYLQDNWLKFRKIYYAVLNGKLAQSEGVLKSLLQENSAHRVYVVTRKPQAGDEKSRETREARTKYRVVTESKNKRGSLVEIELLTGVKHQIRVQFAEAGCPVVGDKLYGLSDHATLKNSTPKKKWKRLMLHALELSILHPHSREKMVFKSKLPSAFRARLKEE